MNLPEHRNPRLGRTFSAPWDGVAYGAAVQRYRWRAGLADRLCWLATAVLLAGAAWMVWG